MLVRRVRQERFAHVAGDTAETTSTIVYILGIGFIAYVALEFVLPAIFGATAKTRRAYSELKGASKTSSSAALYSRPALIQSA
jgi:hypothetical protein